MGMVEWNCGTQEKSHTFSATFATRTIIAAAVEHVNIQVNLENQLVSVTVINLLAVSAKVAQPEQLKLCLWEAYR